MKRALARAHSLAAEESTTYEPSLKSERNSAAQRILSTLNVGKPFSVVVPQRKVSPASLVNRIDQGPSPVISHEPMQADTEHGGLLFDQGARSTDTVRSLQPFKFPTLPAPQSNFQTLRVWEGVIVDLGNAKFKAVLTDVGDLQFSREAGEFYLTEVSEGDRPLVELGAVFYWYVGVEISKARTLREVSALRFRRLPGWSTQQVKSVEKEADRLERLFERT